MLTIFYTFYVRSSSRTSYITYHKTACFGPSSSDVIRCKPKLSFGKKMVCAYRDELVFMDYREDVWKQIVQKRRYSYANVYDVI